MYSTVYSVLMMGLYPQKVCVETDISDGLPVFQMVGYLSASVREARERVCTAIRNGGVKMPAKKITVNLSPAGLRKQGAGFDLPLALSVLAALGLVKEQALKETMILGELGLDGSVRPVRGVLPAILFARDQGFGRCLVPLENVREGELVEGIDCVGTKSLMEAVELLNHPAQMRPVKGDFDKFLKKLTDYPVDFAELRGQKTARRAAEAAVAGMHNLLILGPQGSGKTMLSRRIPTIFPPLTLEESMEISKIYSVTGLLSQEEPMVTRRPFRVPHHTLTENGMCGGGRIPTPGEISLAHLGVLFLDELTEYPKPVLECLRQPMEDASIQLSRVSGTFVYPADFMLVAAMNPCPCGYYPDREKCTCSPGEIRRHLEHISQPLLDRMDICVEMPRGGYAELKIAHASEESSARIRDRVIRAVLRQRERFAGTGIRYNAGIPSARMAEFCPLGRKQEQRMEQLFGRLDLSARAYHKILKVARTLADLEDCPNIQEKHLHEAVLYRSIDKKYWIH